ncbi:MAG TPA: hypothetical protein ENN03_03975 [bacterium]|nr:hypothetical protein [bacterium]
MKKQTCVVSVICSCALIIILSSCQFDLNVPNLNEPDRERVLSNPRDLEALVSGAYLYYWFGTHYYAPSLSLSVMADEHSSSWNCTADAPTLSNEPRQAWNNSAQYRKEYVTRYPWWYLYRAISMCTDGCTAVNDGHQILGVDGSDQTIRALAYMRFVMGICHAWLGCFFDQGFILDETVDLEVADPVLVPYGDLVDHGVGQLEKCIAICDTAVFRLPDTWINGCDLNQDELKALAHSYIARFRVFEARSRSEREEVDWASVRVHAEQGITEDFFVQGDGNQWWSGLHFLGQAEGWYRSDYKGIGPADTSGNYQIWLDTPVQERQPFFIYTPDLRLCSGVYYEDWEYYCEREGTDFSYRYIIPFRPDRGTYHFSYYYADRYIEHLYTGGASPMPDFLRAEIDLILAEYYLRQGDGDQAAYYINKTRTIRGGLEPVSSADGIGSVSDPRSIFGSLWATLKYEKGIELFGCWPGGAFFDRRGWESLVKNTIIHFPVPGRELEVLMMDNYTFGGGGPGSAPKRMPSRDGWF